MDYIRNFKGWVASVVVLVTFLLIRLCSGGETTYQESVGEKYSTFYSVTYKSDVDLSDSIAILLYNFDYSLSPFNKNSILSSINNNDTSVRADELLKNVITLSHEVYVATSGAFDPTISPLINAWGFGFKTEKFPNAEEVDSFKTLVGMDKIMLSDDGRVVKANPNASLNFSAIAKGYIVDLIAEFLDKNGITDYLVNIGGEINCKGVNPKGEEWRIGVDTPDESNIHGGDIHSVLQLTDKALATSGNYRKYKVEDAQKVWHIIDPRTGYPTQARVLSATVVANSCAIADAYATALMVLGMEEGMSLIETDSTLEAMFICPGDTTQYSVYYSTGFKKYLKQ